MPVSQKQRLIFLKITEKSVNEDNVIRSFLFKCSTLLSFIGCNGYALIYLAKVNYATWLQICNNTSKKIHFHWKFSTNKSPFFNTIALFIIKLHKCLLMQLWTLTNYPHLSGASHYLFYFSTFSLKKEGKKIFSEVPVSS